MLVCRTVFFSLISLLAFLGAERVATAAAGDLDATFATTGFVRTDFRGDDQAYGMAVQTDGKYVVVGSTSSADLASTDFLVVRYNANGTLDTTFGTGGKVSTSIGTGTDIAIAVAIQADGKIVVAGETNDDNATNANFAVVRYTATGALDTTFGTGGKVTTGVGTLDDYGTCVAIQGDGKILVGGATYTGADTTNFALVRYTTTGALDTTFNSTGKVSTDLGGVEWAEAVIVLSTGKIVLAGSMSNNAVDYSDFAVVRYNANGSLDTTFNTTGKVITNVGATYDFLDAITVQSDGKIIAVGTLSDNGIGLVRYNTNGSLDTTFNGTGKVMSTLADTGLYDSLHAVALQSDGKILVAGSSGTEGSDDIALARFNPTGEIDTTFGINGRSLTNISPDLQSDIAYAISMNADGTIMVAGDSASDGTGYDFILARFQGVGSAPPAVPTLATSAAGNVATSTATLNGSVNANGVSATITFEYGTSTSYGSVINATPGTLSSSTDTAVAASLTGLSENTTYHFRLKATTAAGSLLGDDRSFTTTTTVVVIPPPVITKQPRSVSAEAGASIALEVQATGSGLVYQWQRNGSNVSNGNSPTLTISNFQSANAGSYTCDVTNDSGGKVTSSAATLSLVANFGAAIELVPSIMQTADPAQWSVVTADTLDGEDALKSGSPAVGGSSKLSALITGPVRLNYFYKLVSTTNASFLRVYVDGAKVSEFTGNIDWTMSALSVPTGSHQVVFSFDQDAAGGTGEAAWLDQFLPAPATWIDVQPVSKVVAAGTRATLEVVAGGEPTTYQWRKNSVVMPGETSSQLVFDSVAPADAQLYTVALGNGDISNPVALTVVSGARSVRQPLTKTAVFTQTLTNGGGAFFQWMRGTTNLIDGTKYAGAKTASLSIKTLVAADAGVDYYCKITLGMQTTVIGPYELSIQNTPTIAALPVQSAMVSCGFSLQLQATESPTAWTASVLPPGLTFNTKTGLFGGTPTAANKLGVPYSVIVTATNAAGVGAKSTITFDIAPLPDGIGGSFYGLVDRSVPLNDELGGCLKVVVAGSGSFTGTLRNGKDTHTLTGRVVYDVATDTFLANQLILRTGRASLLLALVFAPDQNSLTGTISSNGEQAQLSADRQIWTAAQPASSYTGLFNNALELPLENVGDGISPQGTGFNQLNLSSLGTVTISGRTADGMVITGSNIVTKDGRVALFYPFYANKGSVHGRQFIHPDGSVTSDGLTWIKTGAASLTDRNHPYRFDVAPITSGARYVKPTTAKPIVLGLADQANNVAINFGGECILDVAQYGSLAQNFRISKTNLAAFRTAAAGNPCAVKMTIVPGTGLFSGSFAITDPGTTKSVIRTVSYFGIFLSHRNEGVGYFLLPPLAPANAIFSGTVQVPALVLQ